jgi:hypothetical protein
MASSPSIIGTLRTSAGSSIVSWKDGKRQIRAAAKKAGIKLGSGTFRMRRENRGEYVLSFDGGSVRARRKPGAEISVQRVQMISVENLSAAQLAEILAQG